MRQGEVFFNGIRAGVLTEEDTPGGFTFAYDKAYILGENPAISLTLPLQDEPYRSEYLFPFFANMLSEGENRRIQSQLLHIDEKDDFGIMLATCRFDTIGAVTVRPLE